MECVSDSHLEPPHCSISIRLSLNFCANSIFNNEFVLMNGNVNMWNLYVWAASSSEKKTRAESSSWCNTYALNNNTWIYVLHSLIKCSTACTIERTADFSQYECSMRRFSKSLALFTRHHPHCLSLVNSPILFSCAPYVFVHDHILMASFSMKFISASTTRIFIATNIHEWKQNAWVERERHRFILQMKRRKQPPAEIVDIKSIDMHSMYFIWCPLLSWLNGNPIISLLFFVITSYLCGFRTKKNVDTFRWQPTKNIPHRGFSPTHPLLHTQIF